MIGILAASASGAYSTAVGVPTKKPAANIFSCTSWFQQPLAFAGS